MMLAFWNERRRCAQCAGLLQNCGEACGFCIAGSAQNCRGRIIKGGIGSALVGVCLFEAFFQRAEAVAQDFNLTTQIVAIRQLARQRLGDFQFSALKDQFRAS